MNDIDCSPPHPSLFFRPCLSLVIFNAEFHDRYNLWHPNSGCLNVSRHVPGMVLSHLWTRCGPQGKEWQQGKVHLRSDTSYQLIFEALLTPQIPGVIAIDELTLKDGTCDDQTYWCWFLSARTIGNSFCSCKCT
ncbi:hypothetical protein V5799_033634 [Amblyomma americanum]|uniref:MAM domain-containing protein n=1 Tax=Amblyomma americanum TaxID=6943 RepID=A0AAQ4DMR8_AMBAM